MRLSRPVISFAALGLQICVWSDQSSAKDCVHGRPTGWSIWMLAVSIDPNPAPSVRTIHRKKHLPSFAGRSFGGGGKKRLNPSGKSPKVITSNLPMRHCQQHSLQFGDQSSQCVSLRSGHRIHTEILSTDRRCRIAVKSRWKVNIARTKSGCLFQR